MPGDAPRRDCAAGNAGSGCEGVVDRAKGVRARHAARWAGSDAPRRAIAGRLREQAASGAAASRPHGRATSRGEGRGRAAPGAGACRAGSPRPRQPSSGRAPEARRPSSRPRAAGTGRGGDGRAGADRERARHTRPRRGREQGARASHRATAGGRAARARGGRGHRAATEKRGRERGRGFTSTDADELRASSKSAARLLLARRRAGENLGKEQGRERKPFPLGFGRRGCGSCDDSCARAVGNARVHCPVGPARRGKGERGRGKSRLGRAKGARAAGPRALLGRGDGHPAGPRQEGGEGEKKARLGRAQGNRPKREGKGFPIYFSYFSHNSSLECMIHKPSQSNNKMHDSAWCIKQKKVLLGFTYTRSQTESRYNFGKDQGLARGKGKRKG